MGLNYGRLQLPEPTSMSENIAEAVQEHVGRIEASLKPDQRLVAYCVAPNGERVHAVKLQFTTGQLILVHGFDENEQPACMMLHVFSFQLVCKIVKSEPDVKKNPIGFILPKPELSR
jgi:hypothetical protein